MLRLARLAVPGACALTAISRLSGWDGPWLVVPALVAGVGGVIMVLQGRSSTGADEPAVLDLNH